MQRICKQHMMCSVVLWVSVKYTVYCSYLFLLFTGVLQVLNILVQFITCDFIAVGWRHYYECRTSQFKTRGSTTYFCNLQYQDWLWPFAAEMQIQLYYDLNYYCKVTHITWHNAYYGFHKLKQRLQLYIFVQLNSTIFVLCDHELEFYKEPAQFLHSSIPLGLSICVLGDMTELDTTSAQGWKKKTNFF